MYACMLIIADMIPSNKQLKSNCLQFSIAMVNIYIFALLVSSTITERLYFVWSNYNYVQFLHFKL